MAHKNIAVEKELHNEIRLVAVLNNSNIKTETETALKRHIKSQKRKHENGNV